MAQLKHEQALIGCILIDENEGLYACRKNGIKPSSFADVDCRNAFTAIQALANISKPIDLLTVDRQMDAPCQSTSLEDMVDAVATSTHSQHYAELVKEDANRRDLALLLRVTGESVSNGMAIDEAVNAVQSAIVEITGANGVSVKTIGELRDAKIEQWKIAQKDGFIGVPFTLPAVNKSLGGWRKGCVGIIAGYRGEGKSTLVRQQCLDLAKSGTGVALFTLEDPDDIASASMVGYHAEISVFGLDTGRSHPDKLNQIDERWQELEEIPLFISSGSSKMDEIEATANMLKMKHGIDIVFIDHIQYVTPLIMRGMSRNDTMAYYSQRCSAMAKSLDVPVVLASQLSRDSEKANRKPKLSDLRDSGTLEQDSRQIIMLYYDGEKDHHILELLKNNFGESRVSVDVERMDGRQHFKEVH